MRGFNKVIIAGNLTKDPDVRSTVNKKTFARFGVAVNRMWKNENGEQQESTEYINVVVWGAQAENCGKFLKKGSPVLIEGRIQTSTFDARDGSGKRYMTEVNADSVIFLGSGQGNSSGNGGQRSNWSGNSQPNNEPDFGGSISDSGFGGGFPTDFGENDESPDTGNEGGIPF